MPSTRLWLIDWLMLLEDSQKSRSAVDTGEYSEFSEMTGLQPFVAQFPGHIAAEAAQEKTLSK